MASEVFALPNQEARTVAQAFVENLYNKWFEILMELYSYQGRYCESQVFQKVCETGHKENKKHRCDLLPQSDDNLRMLVS